MTERIITQLDGPILTITNNNPSSLNSLSPEFYIGLAEELDRAKENPSIKVIVITGAGNFFCSGGNLSVLKERTQQSLQKRRVGIENLHRMVRSIRNCPQMVIAAVEGGAAGAGVSLALACDLVVSSREAKYSISYVKVGLTPDGGISSVLSQALPRQLVTELLATGSVITAERLEQFGLINRLTETGEALGVAQRLAQNLCDGPARSLGRIKQLCHAGQTNDLDRQLDLEADLMAESMGDAEAVEGIQAFFDKRTPIFKQS